MIPQTLGATLVASLVTFSLTAQVAAPAGKPATPAPTAPAAPSSSDKIPRMSDSRPDMQGLWANGTAIFGLNIEPPSHLQKYGAKIAGGAFGVNRTIVIDPPDGVLPFQPWALERRNTVLAEYLAPSPALMDPQTRGWPNGVPRLHYYGTCNSSMGGPIQIMQPPGSVVFFYEVQHEFRIVPLDGRPHSGKDIKLWMGDSRGRWEGDTLVIDVTNHNDSTRFDVVGDFHSDAMQVTERWKLADKDTLEYRATIDDPTVYTKPWTIGVTHKRCPAGSELFEYAGVEGTKAVEEAEAIRRSKGLTR
jgi:hypothetical protein